MRVLNFHTTLLLPSCVHFHFFIHHLHLTMSDTLVSRRPNKKLEMLGDINLGALVSMSQYDNERRACSEKLYSPMFIHWPLAMEYMVSEVNRMKILPRNLTLGIVVLDDCYSVNQAMAQCLSFLPQIRCDERKRISAGTKSYDVVGVIGSYTTAQTKFIAKTLSTAEIPVVGFKSRSDDLSDKEKYPFFSRTTTSESPLYKGFSRLLRSQNWTYLSVVYEGDYSGITLLNTFRRFIEETSCLATVQSGTMESNEAEIDRIVLALKKTIEARVVVLLTTRILAHKVIQAASQLSDVPQGYFIWVDLVGWVQEVESMKDLGKLLWGTLLITDYCNLDRPYHEHFKNLTQNITFTRVPWFQDFMKEYVSCSHTNTECNSTLQGFMNYAQSGRVLEAVFMFAKAISRILESSKCIEIKGNNNTDRDCITGLELQRELFKTSYTGYCEELLHIDQSGDRNTSYQLRQVLPGDKTGTFYDVVAVVRFSGKERAVNLTGKITWQYHWLPPGKTSPESSCSVPCTKRQAKVIQENKCCWRCHDCRDNEYFVNNRSKCEPCPMYTWPNPDTDYYSCREIPPRGPRLWSTKNFFHMASSALFTIGCTSIVIFFIRHKNSRIIKASSTMLSFLMLFAIFLGNVTIIMLRIHPTDAICRISFLFFCTSFSLLYAALLTRAFVIYRIFTQSLLSARRPTLTSRADQIKMCVGFLIVQIGLCAGVLISDDTWVKKTMADVTEEFVEVTCTFPFLGLELFLAYNLVMLALCSYLAYQTRNLPSNYNETFYISMCVFTTLFIWLALSPSYYITTKHYIKRLLLNLAITINHFVAIAFLFLPKVYVIVCADDYFQSRFYKPSTSGSAVTNSSIGSQDIAHTDKRKSHQSVLTSQDSIGGASGQFYAQHGDLASLDVIKVNEDLSENKLDLSHAPDTHNKNKHLKESKETEEPTKPKILRKPAETSAAIESAKTNDPLISNEPKLQTAPKEMSNTNEDKSWQIVHMKDLLLEGISGSKVSVDKDYDSYSGANYPSGDERSESGVDSNFQ